MEDSDKTPARERGARARQVHNRLREDILSGHFAPQTILREDVLADRYDVSRTPVREALRQLLDEALIGRTGRFYSVAELTPEDIRDLYETRAALEAAAVRLCIERGGPEAPRRLSALLDTQEEARLAGLTVKFFLLDSAFHLCLAELSQNRYLQRQLRAIHDRLRLVRAREEAREGWTERVVVEHRRILSALARRSAAAAEAEMRYHIDSAARLHLGLPQQPIQTQG